MSGVVDSFSIVGGDGGNGADVFTLVGVVSFHPVERARRSSPVHSPWALRFAPSASPEDQAEAAPWQAQVATFQDGSFVKALKEIQLYRRRQWEWFQGVCKSRLHFGHPLCGRKLYQNFHRGRSRWRGRAQLCGIFAECRWWRWRGYHQYHRQRSCHICRVSPNCRRRRERICPDRQCVGRWQRRKRRQCRKSRSRRLDGFIHRDGWKCGKQPADSMFFKKAERKVASGDRSPN